MTCNSCHNHGGGMYDEDLLKHGLSVPNPPFGNASKGGLSKGLLIVGGLVLGAVILTKWSKT
tara:strand:+ start:535 stop:720 length:186 start_codon:yes stop_codon:yes gene_type:complete